MSDEKRVLVYGATGVQSGPLIPLLRERGYQVRVLVRSPQNVSAWQSAGVEVVPGDLYDPAGLQTASAGVAAVLLQLPLEYDYDRAVTQGRNAIDAAQAAGVRFVVFNTSIYIPDAPTDTAAFEIKRTLVQYLQQRGVPHIVLKPRVYLDNWLQPAARAAIANDGVLAYPLPRDERVAWISAADTARLMVAALERPDLAGRTYDIGGPDAVTGDELATHFAAVLGRPMRYVPLPVDAFEQGLSAALGPVTGREIARIYRLSAREYPAPLPNMATVLRDLPAQLTPLNTWIRRQDWTPAPA